MEQVFKPRFVTGYKEEKDGKTSDVAPTFSGHIKIKLLSFEERMDLAEISQAANGAATGIIRKVLKDYRDHFVEVSLVRLADKAEFTSLDSLNYGRDCHTILQEAALQLLTEDKQDEEKTSPP